MPLYTFTRSIIGHIAELDSGTAEVVGHVGALDQLGEIFLSELDRAVLPDAAVGIVVAGLLNVLQVTSQRDLGVANGDNGLGVIPDHGGLQGVEGIPGSLFTGHGLDVGVLGLQAGIQANGQSAQQHLHEDIAGREAVPACRAAAVVGPGSGCR